jgi:hypothetical protein
MSMQKDYEFRLLSFFSKKVQQIMHNFDHLINNLEEDGGIAQRLIIKCTYTRTQLNGSR